MRTIWFRTPRILAEQHGIPVYEPESLRDPAWVERIRAYAPDYLFSFYYRHMLPKEILDIPRIAPLNLHGSLLPRFRGRCPVNWVLIEGEKRTGVTLHVMETKPDAGDIVAQKEVDIAFEDTARILALKLASAAPGPHEGRDPPSGSGHLRKKTAGRGRLLITAAGSRRTASSTGRSAMSIYNLIRAVTHPYPGPTPFFAAGSFSSGRPFPWKGPRKAPPGTVVSINPLLIKTGKGLLQVTSLQLEGEDEMDAERFLSLHDLTTKSLGGKS